MPCVVDLAAMRDGIKRLGGDPAHINPLVPCELVIDHSVQVDDFGNALAFAHNTKLEYERNRERYTFLRWGQNAFRNFQVVPPETGIVHQVNLEYLARVVFVDGQGVAYPDTLVGTDSHTTMVNGLGVLGWGVGGIEAEAAMLGQPVTMLIPQVVGFKLHGKLREGTTATDLVLTVTQMLRKKGVVGKFVEFFGDGLAELPLADRATIANMAPEYGATCGIFPVDAETLRYLRQTGRPDELVALVEAYCKEQGMFHSVGFPEAAYTDVLELDLATVEPSLAGPSRPQDRVALQDMKQSFQEALPKLKGAAKPKPVAALPVVAAGPTPAAAAFEEKPVLPEPEVKPGDLRDGSVVIAAITSCTNTSNPSVMVAAGILAKKAAARGLSSKPWVKTSLAPGSKVVTDYLSDSGLLAGPGEAAVPRRRLRLHHLHRQQRAAAGGRLQRGRRRAGWSCRRCSAATATSRAASIPRCGPTTSPPRRWWSPTPWPARWTSTGRPNRSAPTQAGDPVYLRDLWPTQAEVQAVIEKSIKQDVVPPHLRPGVRRRRQLEGAGRADRRPVPLGRRSPPTSPTRRTSWTWASPRRRWAKSSGRGCWRCWATASPPTTSARPAASRRTARPAST